MIASILRDALLPNEYDTMRNLPSEDDHGQQPTEPFIQVNIGNTA